jgi:hypothetical protein
MLQSLFALEHVAVPTLKPLPTDITHDRKVVDEKGYHVSVKLEEFSLPILLH